MQLARMYSRWAVAELLVPTTYIAQTLAYTCIRHVRSKRTTNTKFGKFYKILKDQVEISHILIPRMV